MQPIKKSPPSNKPVLALLNPLLSDVIDLSTQAKQAHWNVTGENFIALHELFDTLATEVYNASDLIAERIRQLGGQAVGTARAVAKQSRLKEYPLEASDGKEHLKALVSALSAFNGNGRRGIDESTDLGDAVTADILTEIVRGFDKQIWFLESHLE